jgi:hypothetical protein
MMGNFMKINIAARSQRAVLFYMKGGGFKLNEELTKLLNAKKIGLRVSSRLATEK